MPLTDNQDYAVAIKMLAAALARLDAETVYAELEDGPGGLNLLLVLNVAIADTRPELYA